MLEDEFDIEGMDIDEDYWPDDALEEFDDEYPYLEDDDGLPLDFDK